jgi:hypothetical protein
MDFFVVHAFIEAVKRNARMPFDVYQAATVSGISQLSEQSIAVGSAPQEFPDFTRGRWMRWRPTFGFGDAY